jgi:hypothetical protein
MEYHSKLIQDLDDPLTFYFFQIFKVSDNIIRAEAWLNEHGLGFKSDDNNRAFSWKITFNDPDLAMRFKLACF